MGKYNYKMENPSTDSYKQFCMDIEYTRANVKELAELYDASDEEANLPSYDDILDEYYNRKW